MGSTEPVNISMIMVDYTPGRWHNKIASPAGYLGKQYSTPRAWFRRSAQTGPVNSEASIYNDERYITAAAIFPLGSRAVQGLVNDCPWAMVIFFPGRDYSVVLVSCSDRLAWANAAELAGALAWYIMDDSDGELYRYTKPTQLVNSSDYRPPRLGDKRGKKGLNHEEIRDQIIQGYFSDAELAEQYSVTRQTISNIRKKFGLRASTTATSTQQR